MMDFMREGGFPMWIMLASFIGAAALAWTRPADRRGRILALAAVWVLVQGVAGMATGIHATVRYLDRVPPADTARILAAGLGEFANNGVFAAVLATLLGVAYVVTTRDERPTAA